MKLLKKLLPLGIIATATTAVVPMVVSCGNNVVGTSDLNFKPDEKHEAVDFDSDYDAMKEYTNKVNANPNILVQDFYWTMAQEALQTDKVNKKEEGYQNGSVTFLAKAWDVSLKIIMDTELTNYFLLSGNIEYEMHSHYNAVVDKAEHISDADMSTKLNMKNIPIYIQYDGTAELEWRKWRLSFDYTIETIDILNTITTDYQLDIEYSDVWTQTYLNDGKITNQNSRALNESKSFNKDNAISDDFWDDLDDIIFCSYYFLDCSI